MKSKELAKNFIDNNPTLNDDIAIGKSIIEMLNQFLDDLKNLMDVRGITTDQGTIPIIRELNQKWNAVRNKLEKHYGHNVIVKDGFLLEMKQQVPVVYEYYMQSLDG